MLAELNRNPSEKQGFVSLIGNILGEKWTNKPNQTKTKNTIRDLLCD